MGETWFGPYRLERLLGSGGSGRVWLAHDTATGRDVALKVLAADLAADPGFRRRFTREARLAAQLRGPHTVTIHGFGEHDGRLYLDMELIDGIDAAALLRREVRLAPGRATGIVAQAGAALAAAHRIGLVHRDVKPSNLMVTPEEFVYLIDFGTATRDGQPAITATGQLVGTLGYVAPERFSGAADARSDQYSLACVLFELLTGRRPFGDGDSPQQVLAHLMTAPPAASMLNPAVPRELDAVIARGMAKEPGERFAEIEQFVAAARAAAGGSEIATTDIAPATIAGVAHRHPPAGIEPGAVGAAVYRDPPSETAPGNAAAGAYRYPPSAAVPATRPDTVGAGNKRPMIAVGALAGLAVVIGGVLYLDRPDATGITDGAPSTPPAVSTTVLPPLSAAPIAEPVTGEPCAPGCGEVPPPPAVEPEVVVPDGGAVAVPDPGGETAEKEKPGNGPGSNNGNGNGNNGNGKPPKPPKPDK